MIKKGDYVVSTAEYLYLTKNKIYYVYKTIKNGIFIFINDDRSRKFYYYSNHRFRKMTKKEIKSRSTEIIILKLKGKL